jgi:hypothetical protein
MSPLDAQRFMSNIGEHTKFVMEHSVEVRDRMLMLDRDVGDFLRGQIGLAGKPERIRAAASRFGMYVAVKIDASLAMMTWYGEYQRALESGLSHEDAKFRGELAVVRQFGSQTTMNLPLAMRGSEFTRWWTMFLGFMNTAYNNQRTIVRLSRSGMKKIGGGDYAGGTRDFVNAAANTFAWVLLITGFGWLYNPTAFSQAKDWDDWVGGFAELLLGNLAAEIPLVRDIVTFLSQDYNPRGNPIFTVAKEMTKPAFDIYNAIRGEDVSDRWIEHALNVPGYVWGLPTAAPARAAQYLWNTTTNQDDMDSFGDFARGILFGRSDPNKK